MSKEQNRALFIALVVATCLAPPALATARGTWVAQATNQPDALNQADAGQLPTPTETPASTPTVNFTAPAEGIPQAATLTIATTSSMATITRSLVQTFQAAYPDAEVTVTALSSAAALENVLAGDADLAAVGRPLSDEQRAAGLTPVSVSREKIAVIVGTNNPFNNQLEAVDFVRIFRGEVTNWQAFGGPDIPIRLVDRPATSDTRAALGDYEIFGGDLSTGENVVPVANDDTAEVVEALGDNGIGYAIASQVLDQDNVRVIPMHDTLPDNAQYPYSQPRNYVYLDQEPLPPEVEAFLALATNPEGQAAIATAKAAEAADVAVADLPDRVLAVRPDGQGFVTGDRDGTLNFWNADGTAAGDPVSAHTGPVTALTFSDDGQRLISGGADGTLRLWEATGAPIGEPITTGDRPVTSLLFQPDGSFLSATAEGDLQQWNDLGNSVGQPIAAHNGTVRDMTFSPDNSTLVTAGADGVIRRWNAADFSPVGEPLAGHRGPVQALAMQPDGSFLSGGADGTVRQWAADGTSLGEPEQVPGPVTAIAVNPEGTSIVVGDETGALQYFSGAGVPVAEPLTDVGAPVADLAFLPTTDQLVVSTDQAPQLRDSTGQLLPIPEAQTEAPAEDAAGEVANPNLPPALQNLWDELQGLPPQVLWIIPLALLVILLLGLLRSFRQDQEDLVAEDEPTSVPPSESADRGVDDFAAEDFAAADFATDDVAADAPAPAPVAGLASDEAAASLDPSLAMAKQTLSEGVSLGNAGQYQSALDRFNKAIELADMERLKAAAAGTTLVGAGAVIARGLARRGNALANLGRSDEALSSLNRALEMDPNDAAAWIGKGNVLMPMGQLDEALFCFDKAIELNSNLGTAWQGKGKALQKMGRNAEARQCFDTAESLGGLNDDIPIDLGTPAARTTESSAAASESPRSVAASPVSPVTPPNNRGGAIAPGPIPPSSASLVSTDESPDTPPVPAAVGSTAGSPSQPTGPIGIAPPDPATAFAGDSEIPADVLAAISDLPPIEDAPADVDTPAPPPAEIAPPASVAPSAPRPDTPETAVPEAVLQAVDPLPAEPEDAAADAPLADPIAVPPEVAAILAGDSDIPAAEETASDAAVQDPMATLFGNDPAMAMRSPAEPPVTEAPADSPQPSPAPATPPSAERPEATQVPDQPPAEDETLAGLPPDVLEALEDIPTDSPDSFDLPATTPKPPPPPPPPHNPRIRDNAAEDTETQD